VEDLEQAVRSVLGEDLPLIDDGVTIAHLLAHRPGIGDHFDEDVIESMTDYVMPVPVHRLATTPTISPCWRGIRRGSSPGSGSRTTTVASSSSR
jgi:hypothetical protein